MRTKTALVFSIAFLFLAACSSAGEDAPTPISHPTPVPTAPPEVVSGLSWDPAFEISPCDLKRDAPLLDEVLANVNLTRPTFGAHISDNYFGDEFTLPWVIDLLERPLKAECYEELAARSLDYYLTQSHPVAGIIRHSATLLYRIPDKEPPIDPAHLPGDFGDALLAVCQASGGSCGEPQGELPEDLKEALAPIFFAIVKGIEARGVMDEEAERTLHDPAWWHKNGGNLLLGYQGKPAPNPSDLADRAFLTGERGRRELYRAASQIAFAIEHTDWSTFVGRMGITYDVKTPAGWIRIRDGSDYMYEEDGEDTLFFLDLGGNDIHVDDIASNKSAKNPVSIAVDLAGEDTYTYRQYEMPYDDIQGIAPADEDGRYENDISRSTHFRQGAARMGIALLFDFGDGDDSYRSLRGSQGYAHLGVGGLFDEDGNNEFFAEEASQGSAQFGIAFAITAGTGNDKRYSFTYSQGFGYVGGAGINLDGGGEDFFVCNNGNEKFGGIPLYNSIQIPGKANSSFCQGAGFGLRTTEKNPRGFFSGGFGVLRKTQGDGVFEASVFAQGSGFWRGAGIFSVGPGNHKFDAYYYAQGGSAHFGVGIAAVGEGNSVFNAKLPPVNMMLGAGHDIGLGVLIKEKGNDEYHIPSLGAGVSNCNGIGLFVENGGHDTYTASSDLTLGVGNIGGECVGTRPYAPSIGIFIDAGGKDVFEWPESTYPAPGDGKTWGYARGNMEFEFGSGLDREGESGIHVTNP